MKEKTGQKLREWGLLALLGILLVLVVWFGISYHTEFEYNLTEKYRQQLSGTASTARQSILGYFEKFSQNLVYLSHHEEITKLVEKEESAFYPANMDVMQNLFSIHRHEVDALILMDTSARVIRRVAADTISPHFMMCIGNARANPPVPADSVYVSEVFMNHRNEKSVTISCPVYQNGKKTGILRWMVTIESISRNFADQAKTNPEICYVLTDEEGRLLTSETTYRNWLCNNLCRCGDFKLSVPFIENYTEIPGQGSGKLRLLPLGCEVYAAWDGFMAGGHQWKMMVMIPAGELDDAMWKHGLITYGMTGLLLLILLMMAWSFFSVRIKKSRLETSTRYLAALAEAQSQLTLEKEERLLAQIGGQEGERKRISRELHDGLGQGLLALRLKIKAQSADYRIKQNDKAEIERLIDEIIEDIKRISADLAPSGLHELGIDKALRRYCEVLSSRSGKNIEYVSFNPPVFPEEPTQIHLFRIAQEALSNVIRHSQATEINVQLLGGKEKATLLIQDNGNGFDYDPGHPPAGNGIRNIRDRVSILRGGLNIVAAPGEGCTITIKIPMKDE